MADSHKHGKCPDCPWVRGDIYQRDCCYPECPAGTASSVESQNLRRAAFELRTACSEAVSGEAAHARLTRYESAALLDLLHELAFQHKDSNKFDRARETLAEVLRA
jgi:hypothetical protein